MPNTIMEPELHWHYPAYNEMLKLRLPREVPQADFVAEIERWADDVAWGWSQRSADHVADKEYTSVFPQARLFSVLLPEGKKWAFRDLRLFCLAWDTVPRTCVVAVAPDGRRRIEEDFLGLLARVEEAHLLHDGEE